MTAAKKKTKVSAKKKRKNKASGLEGRGAERGPKLVRSDGGPVAAALAPSSDEMVRARASATPVAAPKPRPGMERPPASPRAEVDAPSELAVIRGPLGDLERWFEAVVTHPESVQAGADALGDPGGASTVERWIKPSAHMTALERLEVYHFSYHARLVECLADDYPTVQHAVGEERFEELARGYIAAHPSTGPNLNGYGRGFAGFLSERWGDEPFLADLARLEWALVEVVHAPRAIPLSLATLSKLAPESWPELVLVPSPTLRFLELDHPANAYFQAVKDEKKPKRPQPKRSATAVYRLAGRIWRMDFTPTMAAVLRGILAGKKLGDALEAAAAAEVPDEGDVQVWFREWLEGEFFREPEVVAKDPEPGRAPDEAASRSL